MELSALRPGADTFTVFLLLCCRSFCVRLSKARRLTRLKLTVQCDAVSKAVGRPAWKGQRVKSSGTHQPHPAHQHQRSFAVARGLPQSTTTTTARTSRRARTRRRARSNSRRPTSSEARRRSLPLPPPSLSSIRCGPWTSAHRVRPPVPGSSAARVSLRWQQRRSSVGARLPIISHPTPQRMGSRPTGY